MKEQTFDPRPKNHALPKSLTTVTLFSKLLALFLFIALPFLGFYLGATYSSLLNQTNQTPQMFVQKPPTTTTNSTADWKTYETPNVPGYSLRYPANWKITLSKPVNIGQEWNQQLINERKDFIASGQEGNVLITWVDQYGGGCGGGIGNYKWETIKLDSVSLDVCHGTKNGVEIWGFSGKILDKNNGMGIVINAKANLPDKNNRDIVLKILSTFKFTK